MMFVSKKQNIFRLYFIENQIFPSQKKDYIDTIYRARAREVFPPLYFYLHPSLAHSQITFAPMTTYYCPTIEDALKRAKAAGKKPGCHFGGIVLPSGRRGFVVYKEGKVVERYSYCSPRNESGRI